MKKYIKVIIVCLLIMFVVMSISRIVSPIIEKSKIADRYKETYNIEFETPEKLERIFIEGLIDATYLNKLTYDKETYQKILEYDYVLPIDKVEIKDLLKKDNIHHTENLEKLNSIVNYIIEDENNYYAYLEKPGFYHELFLYDVDECTLYILTLVF
ncbi:MAG TPA: hypothetical protein IAB65_05835 [Candidatus Onthocola stercorigallinarum]|nr:hypothetical protein [Candidatus Onthocola stercorigallinarum]